jgi:hypothetical protein
MAPEAAGAATGPGNFRVNAPLIIMLGPLFGAFIMFVVTAGIAFWDNPQGFWSGLPTALGLIIGFGWVLGIVPAVLSAAALYAIRNKLATTRRRVSACIVIGGLSGGLAVWPPMWLTLRDHMLDAHFLLFTALAGALSLCATALPGQR